MFASSLGWCQDVLTSLSKKSASVVSQGSEIIDGVECVFAPVGLRAARKLENSSQVKLSGVEFSNLSKFTFYRRECSNNIPMRICPRHVGSKSPCCCSVEIKTQSCIVCANIVS